MGKSKITEETEVILACNRELEKETFNDYLNKEFYRVAKNTIAGKSKHCKYCCYCYKYKSCLTQLKQRVEKGLCWNAMNRYLRDKEWSDATKNNT